MKTIARRAGACLISVFLVGVCFMAAGLGTASAAGLQPGEYACAGSGGRILIGLGFKLFADGTYTDLNGSHSGRVVYNGSTMSFVGGHLDGQVGSDLRGTHFQIGAISCSVS